MTQIDAWAREALLEPSFSLLRELERPFARVTSWCESERGAVALLVVWEVADELQILSVAVALEARRRGLAKRLVTASLESAKASGLRIALLEVRRSNLPAIRLYRGLGFVALGLRRGYYADGEDAVEMALPLGEGGAAIVAERDEALERALDA